MADLTHRHPGTRKQSRHPLRLAGDGFLTGNNLVCGAAGRLFLYCARHRVFDLPGRHSIILRTNITGHHQREFSLLQRIRRLNTLRLKRAVQQIIQIDRGK
ncbi:MAG: hypothetical protein HYZ46_03550 [Nitrosomonadales bacterium]|nr:hypothetical protein [Nitrosomonadales bacterium]